MTLPLIYTLQRANKSTRDTLIRTVEKYNKDKKRVRELVQEVHRSGGIAYAQGVMETYIQQALSLVNEIPPSPATQSMKDLIGYVIERGN